MSTDPFIAPSDLVAYLGRGGTADPGMLIATDAACDMVRTYTGQQIGAGTTTITLDGTGRDALLLPERPVRAAGTVNVDGTAVTDYVVDAHRGMLIRKTAGETAPTYTTVSWPDGRQNVTVTYEHGYEDADLPRDVRGIALAIAARLAVQGPAIQETIGQTSIRYAVASTDLTPGERLILGKYRRA